MTVDTIVLICFIGLSGLCIGAYLIYCANDEGSIAAAIAGVIVIVVATIICVAVAWWQLNTESGRRAYKDQQSNLSGGIEREVSVYDVNGNLIKQYSGKFDIETDNESYILFDDENGNRHIIYYTTGTIIVDEVG